MDFSDIDFFDWVSLISLFIGVQNLELNKIQVDEMMREMRENQNGMLAEIIKQNKEILSKIKGDEKID